MQWYYSKEGNQYGPVEEEELWSLARKGSILPNDLVWNATMGRAWNAASSIPDLFPEQAQPPPIIPGNEVPEPNTTAISVPLQSQRPKSKLQKFLAPVSALSLMIFGNLAKLKFLLPFLKTGATMIVSIAAYAMAFGWPFAVGFVLLIFVHECGHLVAAKKCGLAVSAPIFIPFMGAIIALKEAPKNAWIEAQVGIGGPILGTVGAALCEGIYLLTGNLLFRALAYTGFFLNLFNLAPVGFLDGGRIVTALSPWLWLIGFAIMAVLTYLHFNFLLLLILVFSLPRLISLFKKKSAAERRYFEVTPFQRWTMAILYFGLIILLVYGMHMTQTLL
jgi:Zn-dependent protease